MAGCFPDSDFAPFFGLINDEKLYFHPNDRTQPKYKELDRLFSQHREAIALNKPENLTSQSAREIFAL